MGNGNRNAGAARVERAGASDRGYGWRWGKARATFLERNPLCRMCAELVPPRVTAATVVDHVTPHRGCQKLFWDTGNWQPLCSTHHSRDKQILEARGYSADLGLDGWPTDPRHPANR